jgi:hypothetical protein
MMDTIIKDTIKARKIGFMIGGAIIGGTAGYLASDLIVDAIFPEDDEDWEELTAPYSDPFADDNPPSPSEMTEEVPPHPIKGSIDYGSMYKSDTPGERLPFEDEPQPHADAPEDAPQICSVDVWNENLEDYAQFTYLYYVDDQKLVNHLDMPVPDKTIESTMTHEAFESFGEHSGDDDVVYVVNDKLGQMYEIVRVHGSFAETLVGGKSSDGDS